MPMSVVMIPLAPSVAVMKIFIITCGTRAAKEGNTAPHKTRARKGPRPMSSCTSKVRKISGILKKIELTL